MACGQVLKSVCSSSAFQIPSLWRRDVAKSNPHAKSWTWLNISDQCLVFDPTTNPLQVPIVQISLPSSSSPHVHYALGQALAPLRAQDILIFASGMSVHNLRDLPFSPATKKPSAYGVSFDEALREAVESEPQGREERMAALVKRPDARHAHPTLDHFWPVVVAGGAGAEEKGERTWGMGEGGLGWAMFRWGEVSK